MKYAQVAAELKAKGELNKVIQMLEQMGQVDYVFYYEDSEEDWEGQGTIDWRHDVEVDFGQVEDNEAIRYILASNYPGFNDAPCLIVSKSSSYLAPVGYEFHYHRWETEEDAHKIVEGSPFAASQVRVNFTVLYQLCPELFDREMLPAGNDHARVQAYWLVPFGMGLQYEVGLELLEACRAA